jgi:ATP-binding cassette, subfamily B, bacterial
VFQVFRAYAPVVMRLRWLVLGALLFVTAATIADTYLPWQLKRICAEIEGGAPSHDRLWQLFGYGIIGVIITQVFWRAFDACLIPFEIFGMKQLDRRCFAVLQRQELAFFESEFVGALVRKASRLRNSFERVSDILLINLWKLPVLMLIVFHQCLREFPNFAPLFAGWLVVFLIVVVLTARWKYPYDERAATSDSAITAQMADSLTNRHAVVTYGQEGQEASAFEEKLRVNYGNLTKAWLVGSVIIVLQSVMMASLQLLFLRAVLQQFLTGQLQLASVVIMQSYILWLCGMLWPLGNDLRHLFQSIAEAKDMAVILTRLEAVQDLPSAVPLVVTSGEVTITEATFAYGDGAHQISNLSLHISAGQSVAFVGPSGAGKSTLLKLIIRLMDLRGGQIRIDGQDIACVTLHSLRSAIAVVPQDPGMFHRTIRENIAYGRPAATEDEIIDAAKRAHAWDFISALPKGLDTLVGERGVKLSGGERQRIAFARAICSQRRILLLDEPTSALDSRTEAEIQAGIDEVMRGRTCLIVAHRLSTIKHCDHIIVLDGGNIVQQGKHDALLADEGSLYAQLWAHQTGGYIEE